MDPDSAGSGSPAAIRTDVRTIKFLGFTAKGVLIGFLLVLTTFGVGYYFDIDGKAISAVALMGVILWLAFSSERSRRARKDRGAPRQE
jgi:hypothetical protein